MANNDGDDSSPPHKNDGGASSLLGLFDPPPPSPVRRRASAPAVAASTSVAAAGVISEEEEDTTQQHGRSTTQRSNSSSNRSHTSVRDHHDDEQVQTQSDADVESPQQLPPLSPTRQPQAMISDQFLKNLFQQQQQHQLQSTPPGQTEQTPLLLQQQQYDKSAKQPYVYDDTSKDDDFITPKISSRKQSPATTLLSMPVPVRGRPHMSRASQLPSIHEIIMPAGIQQQQQQQATKSSVVCCEPHWLLTAFRNILYSAMHESTKPTTWIGAFMFLLFHVVFALTIGATITRPYSTTSMLGAMTKNAALGIMFGPWPYWCGLHAEIPAMYPTVDLFSAPFLANIAALVDEAMHTAPDGAIPVEDNDTIFLATFTTLAVLSVFISGTLLVLASIFKLVNMGAFLPFPVLCGFFAAVGIMMWTLAFKVDNGMGVGAVVWSGDMAVVQKAVIHHVPTLVVAGIMKYLGPKNPLYVVGVVFMTISMFYAVMFVFDISRQDMIQEGWFWSSQELVYDPKTAVGFTQWAPPEPFGWLNTLWAGKVYWPAVWNAIDPAVALGFLYLIRCSLHGTAMKKNVPNLQRAKRDYVSPVNGDMDISSRNLNAESHARHRRRFSEIIDIEHLTAHASSEPTSSIEQAKPTNVSLKDILMQYGLSQYCCGIVGGFAVTPSVAASSTMYVLRAEHIAPQVGSVLLFSFFYFTDFKLVGYIPKPAFSSLLVLSFIDMIRTWVIKSFFKTKETIEWLAVPLIVFLAFTVGLLQAVFLGIAISTFFFVASFFRSGVVKFMANGVTVRSTIERPVRDAHWLDLNGDLIQIIVLQNYLFFGNASSIESYISSMFEDPEEEIDPIFLPPVPQIIVLDLTLVSGMDTSAVDAFSNILSLCSSHGCKVFLSGVSPSLRQVMALGGVKPEMIRDRAKRRLRFFPDLDSAVGKAEDTLLESDHSFEPLFNSKYSRETGFKASLRMIDEQHETTTLEDLVDLEEHVRIVELQPGDELYDQVDERGLFFIEEGILKIERETSMTVNRVGGEAFSRFRNNDGTFNDLKARTGSIGRAVAELKAGEPLSMKSNFRIARMGPGWVIGSIEALSKLVSPATIVAVTNCRLHYISFTKIEELEKTNALLILRLYKLLAYLMAKRQEVTIGQLGTLHAIMSAPAQKQPIKRFTSGLS